MPTRTENKEHLNNSPKEHKMGYKSIGKRLQMAREEAGFNQEQLAARIGCSQSTLSNYEKGKRRVYLAQLEKIAWVLNKPIEYFLQPVNNYADEINSIRTAEHINDQPLSKALDKIPSSHQSRDVQSHLSGVRDEPVAEDELLHSFRSLSPQGQKLALNFIDWLKTKEVNRNG